MEYLKVNKEDLQDLYNAAWKEGGDIPEAMFEIAQDWGLTIFDEAEGDYEAFAKIYLAFRRKLKHKGLTLITTTSGQWYTLKRVVKEVQAFGEEHGFDFRQASTQFLATANMVAKSMKLFDIEQRADRIHEVFALGHLIQNDENKKLTSEIVEEYKAQSYARTGSFNEDEMLGNDLKYICFVDAAKICKKYKINPTTFVQLMCDEFDWLGFPPPQNLCGKRAVEVAEKREVVLNGHKKVRRVNLKDITKQNQRKHDSI